MIPQRYEVLITPLMSQLFKVIHGRLKAIDVIGKGNDTLTSIRNIIKDIFSVSKSTDGNVTAIRSGHLNSSGLASRARNAFQGLAVSLGKLRDRQTSAAAKEQRLAQINPDIKYKHVATAQVHANNLWKQAISLFNRFNETRDVADHPLKAANAYNSIVEALEAARRAAIEADEASATARNSAHSSDLDLSVVEQARLALRKSQDLSNQSNQLTITVATHRDRMKGEISRLDSTGDAFSKASSILEETHSSLDKTPSSECDLFK